MPDDSAGVYTLPPVYLAKSGETIEALQHNSPLEDIRKALTNRLSRSGVAAMTGAFKIIDGSAIKFATNGQVGLFKTENGIGVAVGGVKIAEFTASGVAGVGIGTPIPLLDDTLPDGCIWPDGRNLTYAALFAKWGTKFGAGDGSTTFGVVDLRGRGLKPVARGAGRWYGGRDGGCVRSPSSARTASAEPKAPSHFREVRTGRRSPMMNLADACFSWLSRHGFP